MESTTIYIVLSVIFLPILAAGSYIYIAGGADDIAAWMAEKYFKASAEVQKEALKKAGGAAAEGFLKDQLKKNPLVSTDELNSIQPGLGNEAKEQFGKRAEPGKGGFGGPFGMVIDQENVIRY